MDFPVCGPDSDSDVSEDENPTATPGRELLWAAVKGDLEVVKRILKSNIEVISTTDKDLYTPLHRAAYSDHNIIVKLLIHHGADPNARTVDGWTPLHSACRWGNIDCVRPLSRVCADVNAVTNSGQTPLHLAASNRNAGRTINYLLRQPSVNREKKNSAGDTARDLALRLGPYGSYFESVKPKTVTDSQESDVETELDCQENSVKTVTDCQEETVTDCQESDVNTVEKSVQLVSVEQLESAINDLDIDE